MPTAIEWTEETFNPWWGCTRVSPACAHCYADTFSRRLGLKLWEDGGARRLFGDAHWEEPLRWNRRGEKRGRPVLVFCASMADVFEDHPALEPHRERLWRLVEATPWLTWQMLTKRPENIAAMLPWPHAPANVWLGTSIENARFSGSSAAARAAVDTARLTSHGRSSCVTHALSARSRSSGSRTAGSGRSREARRSPGESTARFRGAWRRRRESRLPPPRRLRRGCGPVGCTLRLVVGVRLAYSSRLRSNYLIIDGRPEPEHVVHVAVMHRAHKWVRGHRVVALALATSTGGHTPEEFIREDHLADKLAA